jgi:hypothetical protein
MRLISPTRQERRPENAGSQRPGTRRINVGGCQPPDRQSLVAQKHFESSLGHARTASRFRAGLHLFNHISFSLAGMARCLLYTGLLDQALDYADLAIDEGRKSGRPAILCRALVPVFPVFLALGNAERSAQCVAQMADLSASYSLIPLWRLVSEVSC